MQSNRGNTLIPRYANRYLVGLLWAVVLGVSFWAYFPGIDGSYMLDDSHSLAKLSHLGLAPSDALTYILSDSSGFLGRPISIASFVLEQSYFGTTPATSKTINIFLHIVNANLVMWLFAILLRFRGTPKYKALAVACASIWLLAPLSVSTVLYSVQRMAMLAAFFSLSSCILYSLWRSYSIRLSPVLLVAILITLFFCGIYSKENAVVMLFFFVILEVFWFRDSTLTDRYYALGKLRFSLLFAGIVIVLVAVLYALWAWAEPGYVKRPFTMEQRLFTQSRVLWDYVGQFYIPDVRRMGLFHDDIEVSSSVLAPKSTLYSLVGWTSVLTVLGVLIRHQVVRLMAFCILFFLLGHAVESTVLSLEMYYEHRNYLPSVGLALLPAVIFRSLVIRWPELGSVLLAWIIIWAFYFVFKTSSQVIIWSSPPLLDVHNVTMHPGSFRANVSMADRLAKVGAISDSFEYSARAHAASLRGNAITPETNADWLVRDLVLGCVASATLPEAPLSELSKVGGSYPVSSVRTMHLLARVHGLEQCPGPRWDKLSELFYALYLGRNAQSNAPRDVFRLLAVIENQREDYQLALEYTERYLALSPASPAGLLMKLHFERALGNDEAVDETIRALLDLNETGGLRDSELRILSLYTSIIR
ncbi:MAG: hypothetical protein ABJK25_06840 [Halieaceae bacterium]